ncbi:MAG: hypothetical protein K2W94_01840 [Alphaproteobacteria bacterium]|nr:hypothetical protein [Alphaproteobacteria bacterium]
MDATDDALTTLKKAYLRENSINKQIAIYHKLYAKSENYIGSREDFCSKKIQDYIAIAKEGLHYLRYHYFNQPEILQSCIHLENELIAKETEGLTAVEFILFNMKLALAQEFDQEEYPLELDDTTKIILKSGKWKTTPFYQFKPLTDKSFGWDNDYHEEDLIYSIIDAFRDNSQFGGSKRDFAFKPYIIYNPFGGFKSSRIVKHLLGTDGKHRNLCALPIGNMDVENSPHGIYERRPFDFLGHDLRHGMVCWENLSHPGIQHLLSLLEPIIQRNIEDPVIETFLSLILHEFVYRPLPFNTQSLLPDKAEPNLKHYLNIFKNSVLARQGKSFDPRVKTNPFNKFFFEFCKKNLGPDVDIAYSAISSHEDPNHYTQTQEVIFQEKGSTFECRVQRTQELLPANPYYEWVEILEIEHISSKEDKPIDCIDKIIELNGKKFLSLTKEALASNEYGIIKMLLKGLESSTNINLLDPLEIISGATINDLLLKFLDAVAEKVRNLEPGLLV